jgi:ACS family tartrate transporter-like MFS transporter
MRNSNLPSGRAGHILNTLDRLKFATLERGALVGISIAAMGFYASKGPFWSIPSMILTGTAAASGIAWINSVGNLGGFFGPTMVGWAKNYTGSFAAGLYMLAGFALMSGVISALGLRIANPVRQQVASVPAE